MQWQDRRPVGTQLGREFTFDAANLAHARQKDEDVTAALECLVHGANDGGDDRCPWLAGPPQNIDRERPAWAGDDRCIAEMA